MLDLFNLKQVHFIGISSPFASFCAEKLLSMGVKVTASEYSQENENAQKWIKRGILYPGDHNSKYIHPDLDLVVFPNGPIPGNVECLKADELNLNTITLPKLVGKLSLNFKTIAVAGTHGKTTTTALIVWILHQLQTTPNFIIADATDKIFKLNKNYNFNPKSEYLIIESCEYRRQFLDRAPHPYSSLITNVDLDHTDYYHDQADYNSAFLTFINSTQNSVFLNKSGKNESEILKKSRTKAQIIDYYQFISEIEKVFNLHLPGLHNQQNLALAFAWAKNLGLDSEKIIKTLTTYPGVTKRFELVGHTQNQNLVYKDYAHNPKKIESLLKGAKFSFPNKKLVLIFQPHSLERAHTFQEQFSAAVSLADVVLIPNIFVPTREKTLYQNLINEFQFAQVLKNKNPEKEIEATSGYEKLKQKLTLLDQEKNTVFLFASAGDLQDKVASLISLC